MPKSVPPGFLHVDVSYMFSRCPTFRPFFLGGGAMTGWWYTYPSEKSWSSSVGMMTFPILMESHKIHVPNHQAVSC